jgi:hypothetical protein
MPVSPFMPFHIISLTGEATFGPYFHVDLYPASSRLTIAAYTPSSQLLASQSYPFQRSPFAPYAWLAQYELTLLLPRQETQFNLYCYETGVLYSDFPDGATIGAVGVGWINPLPVNTPTRRDFQFQLNRG